MDECRPCLEVEALPPTAPPRDPDPDGARQISTVMALLQLGAGTVSPRGPAQPFF